MDYDSLKRLRVVVKHYPIAVIGFRAGKQVAKVKTSRTAVSGLKNFMPDKIQQALESEENVPPRDRDKLRAALAVIRSLSGCTEFRAIHKQPAAIKQ